MSHRILIADDEENIVISIEFLLKREGYLISVAHDGDEALAKIQSEKPDLVILDVMMPKKTGFEVCQAARSDPTQKNLCVLMLTAKGRDTEAAKGLALGADATLELVEDLLPAVLGDAGEVALRQRPLVFAQP